MRYTSFDSVQELGGKATASRKKTVTIVGLGSIGSSVAEVLARAGYNLRIIDRDRVKEEDLHHLSIYGEEHVSKFKAKEAKKILESFNKNIKVRAFHEDLVDTNAYLVEADVIVECSNDLKTALMVDKAAKKSPVIYVRAQGIKGHVFISSDTRLAQVSAFLEKYLPSPKDPVLGSSSRILAALAVNKTLKLLTGQKVEKNLLEVDGWKFSFGKVPVRKGK